ncbi:BRO-N domain-containing protein [Klebsiella oxytoca]|uniref:BRO-N domain-containing protein n=1 Tax=Klebsiella oxytoca TaxID=571 RepID=UPI003D9E2F22
MQGRENGKTRQCANTNRVSIENIRVGNIDMNSVAKIELSFKGKALAPVSNLPGVWLSSSDLAKALEYSNSRAVTMLYNKYADEFTSGMTQVLEVSTSGNYRKKVRVFSLRGAHLIAMFARTDVAKEFRRWVLDILDHEVTEGNNSPVFSGSVLIEFENGVMTNTKVAQPGERLISVKTLVELMQMNGYVMTTKEEIKGKVLDAIEKLH